MDVDYETVMKWFKGRPFQPFRVFVKDGRVYDVRHRNMNLVAETFVKIGIPNSSGPFQVAHHTEYVAFKEIDRFESIGHPDADSIAPGWKDLTVELAIVNRWFRQEPFQPFRVYLKDGSVLDVRYRNMNLVARSFVKIGVPDLSGAEPRCHHTEYVPMVQIDRIEPLTTIQTPQTV